MLSPIGRYLPQWPGPWLKQNCFVLVLDIAELIGQTVKLATDKFSRSRISQI